MSWNRGSKNLALDSDRYRISQECCLFVLEIPVVQASDAGVYTLHALSSPLGNKSSACFILNINAEEGNEKIYIIKLAASIEVRFACFNRHKLNLFELLSRNELITFDFKEINSLIIKNNFSIGLKIKLNALVLMFACVTLSRKYHPIPIGKTLSFFDGKWYFIWTKFAIPKMHGARHNY